MLNAWQLVCIHRQNRVNSRNGYDVMIALYTLLIYYYYHNYWLRQCFSRPCLNVPLDIWWIILDASRLNYARNPLHAVASHRMGLNSVPQCSAGHQHITETTDMWATTWCARLLLRFCHVCTQKMARPSACQHTKMVHLPTAVLYIKEMTEVDWSTAGP